MILLASLAFAGDVLDDGHAVRSVLAAESFTLTQPYAYEWAADHRLVTNGTLLVIDVDPVWIQPKDARQAVLYVGDTPAERIAGVWPSSRIVVLVPGDVDPTKVPIYFGGYELPEKVDRAAGKGSLLGAQGKGFGPKAIPTPSAQRFDTRDALLARAATLLAEKSAD